MLYAIKKETVGLYACGCLSAVWREICFNEGMISPLRFHYHVSRVRICRRHKRLVFQVLTINPKLASHETYKTLSVLKTQDGYRTSPASDALHV